MEVKAYTISTCAFCWELKRFFYKNKIEYDFVDVDLLEGEEKKKVTDEAQSFCPGCGYPITVIDGKTVVRGYDKAALERIFSI